MKWTFKFLLRDNRVENHTFTANAYKDAFNAACTYAAGAFYQGEVLDFAWVP